MPTSPVAVDGVFRREDGRPLSRFQCAVLAPEIHRTYYSALQQSHPPFLIRGLMHKRLALALLSLSVIVAGSFSLTNEARADHTCEPMVGCNEPVATHDGDWDTCTYTCPGWS